MELDVYPTRVLNRLNLVLEYVPQSRHRFITREVLPETYFLLVIMASDAQAGPFLQFQSNKHLGYKLTVLWNLVNF